MKLTQRQEQFALAYIETGNATEAYRRTYNTTRMAGKTVNEAASRLLANSKVAARLEELRAPAVEAVGITLAAHLEELARLRDAATAAGNDAAAISAEVSRGKAAGLYITKTSLAVNNGYTLAPGARATSEMSTEELLERAAECKCWQHS